MIGQFRQSIFEDSNLSLFQQALNDQFSQIGKIPFINGNLIENVSLTSGQNNSIEHKLGRVAKGYFILTKDSQADIWNGELTDKVIILLSSSNTVVDLWVF